MNVVPEKSDEGTRRRTLHRLFIKFAEHRNGCSSPFASYIEGPRELAEVYRKHADQISEVFFQYIAALDEVLLDFMDQIWGIDDQPQVSQETLNQCGYPTREAPDEWDYF